MDALPLTLPYQTGVIPLTAWEQAGIVVLFVVGLILIGNLLRNFLNDLRKDRLALAKLQKETAEINAKSQIETATAISELQQKSTKMVIDQMAEMVAAQDTQWQNWMEERDKQACLTEVQNTQAVKDMSLSIIQLTNVVSKLVTDFTRHDAEEFRMLDAMLTAKQKADLEKK